jgi:ribosomal protein S18 acetylase RimI-like enzyme
MTPAEPVQVRPFRAGDRDPVLALAPRLAAGVAAWRDPEAVLRAAGGWVSGAVAADGQPGHAVYVAASGDRVVGVLGISEQRHWTGQADAYIGELAVAPGMERRGIATALVTAARAWAAGRGLEFLTLETGAANHGARAFYAALGFQDEEVKLARPVLPPLPG